MAARDQALARKANAEQALEVAKLLFPASTPTAPADNSVQALLQRLNISTQPADGEIGDPGQDVARADESTSKTELLKKAAERGLDLLETVQEWLTLERKKTEFGMQSIDYSHLDGHSLAQYPAESVDTENHPARHRFLAASVSQGSMHAFVRPFICILALSIPPADLANASANDADVRSETTPHVTYVTQTFRNPTTLVHLMAASIVVGWYESVARNPTLSIYSLTRGYIHTLGGRTETISVLGGVVRLTAPKPTNTKALVSGAKDIGEKVQVSWPPYVLAVARAMMARQITMPMGVMGLMTCTFGSGLGKNEVVDMQKLEYLATCVGTPMNETLESFLSKIVPQLIKILAPSAQVASIQATMNILSPLLHAPFKPEAKSAAGTSMQQEHDNHSATVVTSPKQINDALSILLPLLTSTPPTSTIVSATISPILPQLFSLAVYLASDRTADPLTRQELQDVLRAWARLADRDVVVKGIWAILNSGRGWGLTDEEGNEFFWDHSTGEDAEDGGIAVWYGKPPQEPLLKVRPSDTIDTAHIQISSNGQQPSHHAKTEPGAFEKDILPEVDLMPPPKEIVTLLKKADRKEVTSTLYVRCLHAYQELAQELEVSEAHSKKLLLYLQLIMQITEGMSDSLGNQTDQILVFIEQALRTSSNEADIITHTNGQDTADSDDEEDEDGADADAEAEAVDAELEEELDARSVTKLGLMETAIHLLLATLQSNPRLNSVDQPILLIIEKEVENLTRHRLATVRAIARNAKLLLSVKKAMTSETESAFGPEQRSSTMEQYQEALRCLQDPLLPVRGHGLIILQGVVKAPDFDKALVPAIMDIFLQALRDEDSFMYLNAVRGLSSMVDGLGKEVLQSLTSAYVNGLDGGASAQLRKEELDFRLRIGEALTQSVKRCGTALSIYANVLVPRLNRVFPQAYLPTVLRASALSILSTCADVDWRAVIPWAQDLLGACLDLLQLESVRSSTRLPTSEGSEAAPAQPVTEPLNTHDGKHPALRRAALTFLGLLFNSIATSEQQQRETYLAREQSMGTPTITMASNALRPPVTDGTPIIHPGLMQKAGNVLGYLQATDVDSLAAHQAGEALYILRQLRWPVIGS
ncbi:hypothetical protein QFC19_000748 [Naganishia cerealis]|uniref:Uncharacterized protein n=1 Tax=Naganishia cerealis TaxID=610337 RepID=A0ACC2WKT7_9TREE|nr:hypothetical protein QFC19_000748 [Naganishia cerealis]